MPKPTKEFLALQKLWDKKLAASGFEDIEQRDGNLKTWASLFTRGATADVTVEAKQEYFRAAGHFLHRHRFTAFEKKVWALHAEGLSVRNVVISLKDNFGIKTYKRQVHETIQRLFKLMMANIEKENANVRASQ